MTMRVGYVRRLCCALLMCVLLPYALMPIYPFIRPPSTLMLADWLRLKPATREWVALSDISPHLLNAVLSAEDSAFCSHWGLDFEQMQRSIVKAQRHHIPVKATSTLSQQLSKNLFLWKGRSWIRKILEIPLTLWMELLWQKRWILELYLNVVEWDDGVYGAQGAARHYFGVSAAALSPMQAALLATTLPNPARRNAARPGPAQTAMAGTLLWRMQHAAPDQSCLRR